MNIEILAKFCNEFKNKDIDKKFEILKAYKSVYMLEQKKNIDRDRSLEWLYQ